MRIFGFFFVDFRIGCKFNFEDFDNNSSINCLILCKGWENSKIYGCLIISSLEENF